MSPVVSPNPWIWYAFVYLGHLWFFLLIILWLSAYRYCMCFVIFILKYFVCFGAILNDIVLLFSVSKCSLLIYNNVIDICVSILYPVTLLNILIDSQAFLYVFWNVLHTSSCYLQIGTALFFSFQISMPFSSFSCLTAAVLCWIRVVRVVISSVSFLILVICVFFLFLSVFLEFY